MNEFKLAGLHRKKHGCLIPVRYSQGPLYSIQGSVLLVTCITGAGHCDSCMRKFCQSFWQLYLLCYVQSGTVWMV